MRLFVGIELDPHIVHELSGSSRILERGWSGIVRCTSPEQLHLTLKFIGQIEQAKLAELKLSLSQAASSLRQFSIKLESTGCFPPPANANDSNEKVRIIWAGFAPNEQLERTAVALDQCLDRFCAKKETRAFRPHVTIARVKDDYSRGKLRHQIASLAIKQLSQQVQALSLYNSMPGANGSRYEILERFQLAKA